MTQWIEIVNWDKFQHYKDRRPVWIKLHLDLLDNDDYLGPAGRCPAPVDRAVDAAWTKVAHSITRQHRAHSRDNSATES